MKIKHVKETIKDLELRSCSKRIFEGFGHICLEIIQREGGKVYSIANWKEDNDAVYRFFLTGDRALRANQKAFSKLLRKGQDIINHYSAMEKA